MKRSVSIFLVVCLCVSLLTMGVLAAEPTPPVSATRKGIDVSYAQGTINWAAVKDSGIDFVIIQCGYGQDSTSQDDVQFANNVAGCEKYGIPYGIYLYSYATTAARAQGEADHALRLIRDYCGDMFRLPVYYDLEDASVFADGVDTVAVANAFCTKIEAAGYQAGIYSNLNNWNGRLANSSLNQWYKWVAQYNSQCDYTGTYQIWQCTDSGSVSGISGNVDINYMIGNPADHASGTNSLTTDKTTYTYGDAINVTATSQRGSAWVAVLGANDSVDASSYYWYYVQGNGSQHYRSDLNTVSGQTYNIYDCIDNNGGNALVPGNYKVVLLAYNAKGEREILASKNITVQESTDTSFSLSTDKSYYSSGYDYVKVTAYCARTNSWVGIFPADADVESTSSIAWYYCSGYNNQAVGIWDLNWNNSYNWPIDAGEYKVVLFGDGGKTNVLKTVYVSIITPRITTNKTTYCLNEPVRVSTNYEASGAWVGIYTKGTTPGSSNPSLYWYNIADEGNTDVNILEQTAGNWGDYGLGTFTINVFQDSGYTVMNSTNITVAACSDGNKDHKCDNCGTVLSQCSDKTGDGNHTCDYCGRANVTFCSDSSDADHKCDECSTVLAPCTFDQQVVSATYRESAATCTSPAIYYYSCSCGAKGTETFNSGNALGHNYTSVVTAPTCTAAGYTTYTCSRCSDSYTGNATTALGHTETTVNASAATCEGTGYTGDTVCSVCDATIATGTEIAALGHDYTATVTPPTCTDAGYTTHVCSRDSSHTYTDTEVAATGHTWGEYTLTTAPTHEAAGEITRSCTVCGAVDTAVIAVAKTPLMELQIQFVDGRLIITGIYDDFANKAGYLADLSHGILLIPTAYAGSDELSVDTQGRTMINFAAYKDDGTVRYVLTPASDSLSYTVRAFVSYADPVTGATVYVYSDILAGDYAANQGQTLTTVKAG